jgi:hypothetical protein
MYKNNHKLMRRLVEELGLDINAQNYLGQTPLLAAVSNGNPETIRTLMELGADETIAGHARSPNMTPKSFAESFEDGARKAVVDVLDDPTVQVARERKAYEPVTRSAVNIGRPLSFKPKSVGNATYTTFNG